MKRTKNYLASRVWQNITTQKDDLGLAWLCEQAGLHQIATDKYYVGMELLQKAHELREAAVN
jgi:hypothetical protein